MSEESQLRRAPAATRRIEAAALAGILHAALYTGSLILLMRAPAPTDADAVAWYADTANQQSLILGLNLMAISSIAFLWFVAVIRRRAGERENQFFGTVFLGSALVVTGTWLVSATLIAAPALSDYLYGSQVGEDSIAISRAAGLSMLSLLATRFQAVFIIASTTVGRLSGGFGKLLVVVGYTIGALLVISPFPSRSLVWLYPAWVAFVASRLVITRRGFGTMSALPASSGG
jgi:hypothetical protein